MLIIGIAGHALAETERQWLEHPAVSGVILFSRNVASRSQLIELVASLRAAASRPIVICVDQEGGRVQRFRDGFVALPALSVIEQAGESAELAEQHAYLMASEVLACDVDLSFAPVLDLGRGNLAIGDRALSADPGEVARLGLAYLRGMRAAGMASTLKHFPGHGSVREDTHFDAAVDPRPIDALRDADLLPFRVGIEAGADAVMLAHVSYPAIDPLPAGYSRYWIQDILRGEMGFAGVVISDDIGMAAAESAGGIGARLQAHLDAGCDIVLVCTPTLVAEALAALPSGVGADSAIIARLAARRHPDWLALSTDPDYLRARDALRPLAAMKEGTA